MHSPSLSRRRFLATAAAGTALPAWMIEESRSYAQPATPQSANDKPNIALVGCGGMGKGDLKAASNFGNVIAVCDVDEKNAASAAEPYKGVQIYRDFRKLLERQDLHVVITATPDHWHTLVNLAALKAGKDVYSEKPLTLTIDEGKRLVTAVRDTKRILQTGSQQRSDARFRQACELVRNGRIGKLTKVTTIIPSGLHGGPFKTSPVPPNLDWDFWQGQTPHLEYVKERCHFSFRYWYDYSGGTMTDWGAHHNDICLWGLGLDRSGPVSVEGKPLVEPVPGGYTAASQYEVIYTYANGVTHRCASTPRDGPTGARQQKAKADDPPNGVTFEGTDGSIFVTRGRITASRPEILTPLTSKTVSLYVSNNHMGNFFECIRSRKPPICEAEIGHRSVSVCHLGVIAIRLGRKLQWDPEKEQFVNDADANKWLAREQRKPWTYDMV